MVVRSYCSWLSTRLYLGFIFNYFIMIDNRVYNKGCELGIVRGGEIVWLDDELFGFDCKYNNTEFFLGL